MYVAELRATDFRSLARAEVEFVHPARRGAETIEMPNVNLLVGTNGGGKSTVLLAIVASVLIHADVDQAAAMLGGAPANWPRVGSDAPGRVCVDLVRTHDGAGPGGGRGTVRNTARSRWAFEVERGSGRLRDTSDTATLVDPFDESTSTTTRSSAETPGFLAAYGSSRRAAAGPVDRAVDRQGLVAAVASLVRSDAELVPMDWWLGDVAAARREEAIALLGAMLPNDVTLVRDGPTSIGFSQREVAVPRTALSDGLQSFLAWTSDLLFRLHRHAGDGAMDEVSGVVLVDEVDQRIHPHWQSRMLAQLAAALPALQFICTAHSPLLAGGLRPENLIVLEPDADAPGDGAMVPIHLHESIYGMNADQVLRSSYFSLASSRASVFRAELDELARQARGRHPDDAALEFMRRLAHPGVPPDERPT